MNKKYLLIVCAILFLISMTGVWAGENVNQTLGAETQDTLASDINTANEIGLNDNEGVLAGENTWYVNSSSSGGNGGSADPFNNLNDAIDKSSDGDTIMIASGSYVGAKNTGLTIEKNNLNLIKYGDGEAVFDGQHNTRIWTIKATSITIKGLTFQNGQSDEGGALYFENKLINSNIDATFINNTANVDGGANYFLNSLTNVNISGNYYNNKATNKDGGANYFGSTLDHVNITGNYTNNTAKNTGGSNSFEKTLNNTNIAGNYTNNAGTWGGANYFANTLNNTNIAGNYTNNAGKWGGANYFANMLNNTNINGNYNNNTAENGGANHFLNSLTNVNINGNYTNNIANGPNIYNGGGANYFYNTLTNVNINGNYADNRAVGGFGGANHFYNTLTHVNINGNYTNNSAQDTGGANSFEYTLTNVNITGNYMGNSAQDTGGANSFDATLNNVILNGNYVGNSAQYGGANYVWNSINEVIMTGVYINNTGTSAIYIGGSDENSLIRDSIFINNDANIRLTVGNIVLINNWFGNNASNYNETPEGVNVNMGNWLFLNATVDPNTFTFLQTTNVAFKLYSFNPLTNETSDYDNRLMQPIELLITPDQGNVNQSNAALGEAVKYIPNTPGKDSLTASFENVKCAVELTVDKINPNLTVTSQTIDYRKNVTITINYNPNATGKVNIALIGYKYRNFYENLELNDSVVLLDEDIIPDMYNVTVTYSGDENFTNATAYGKLTVNYLDSDIKVVGHTINVTDSKGVMFTVILPKDAEGLLRVTDVIDLDVVKSGRIEGNDLIIEIRNAAYPVGQYNWQFLYLGDDIYANSSIKATSEILIIKTQITPTNKTLDLIVYDTSKITYTLNPEGAAGNVTFSNSNSSVVDIDSAGNIKAIANGSAVITINFSGNENYTQSNTTMTVNISKTTLTINPEVTGDLIVGNTVNVTFTLPEDIDGVVDVTVDGETVVGFTITNNTATISGKYAEGNHTLVVRITDDTKYEDMSDSVNFTITKADPSGEIKIEVADATYGQNTNIEVKLPSDAKGNVTLSVGSENYTKNAENGKASFSIPNLSIGNNTITISYSGDDKYIPVNETVNVTVKKATSKLTASAKTFKDTDKTKLYTVTLKDSKGKAIANAAVTLKVDGKTYTAKTNSKGQATFKLTKLTKTGTFTATVTYPGDKNYNKVSVKAKITVKSTWKTVSKGSKDKAMVKKIQKALKKNGYYLTYKGHYLKIDGIYHDCTVRAVKQFQKAKGLKVTGKVDEKTAKKLGII